MSGCSAQVTIEYLIVLAAFFSFFLLLMGPLEEAFNATVFALDTKNAQAFLNEFSSAEENFLLLGSGSTKKIDARVLTKWFFSHNGKEAELRLVSNKLGKTKKISVRTDANDFGEFVFTKKAEIRLEKKGTALTVNADANSLQ